MANDIIDIVVTDNSDNVQINATPNLITINVSNTSGNIIGSNYFLASTLGALPITGDLTTLYVVNDTNKMYRWNGSTYIEISASAGTVWGGITGTLSNQTDLQNALNAKYNNPTGDTTQYIAGDGSLITFPVAGQSGSIVRIVRNQTGATLTKGTIVYISGATGNNPIVSKAIATSDSTSAQTFGLCQANIANNATGYVVIVGDLIGLNTSEFTEGDQLYLSGTVAGTYTATKVLAPIHLVYIGIITRSHPTLGQIEVKVQNGYELGELHNVQAPNGFSANNDGLFWEASTQLWKNKSIATVLGFTPIKYLLRSTYALMIADGTPTVNTIYTITNDENKLYIRSTYLWKSDGKREWIASTSDN
jgi:hypothetical protein